LRDGDSAIAQRVTVRLAATADEISQLQGDIASAIA
jgi:hypothetical protein